MEEKSMLAHLSTIHRKAIEKGLYCLRHRIDAVISPLSNSHRNAIESEKKKASMFAGP
jgi:hypothetical protein